MNTPEKIASVYLRLNGFFTLNNFTHLPEKGQSMESDILAIRCPNSEEKVNGKPLQIDENFFMSCDLNKNKVIGLIVEVKGDDAVPEFKPAKIEYAKNFFGNFRDDIYLCGIRNSKSHNSPSMNGNQIEIGIKYIAQKVKDIIEEREKTCKKIKSWRLNDELLSDLIYLKKIGLL